MGTFIRNRSKRSWGVNHRGLHGLSSLVAQTVKRLPIMHETRVQSLGREDLLEKEMVTHSSVLAWKIPWMEEPSRLHGVTKRWTRLSYFTFFHFHGLS